VASLLSREEQAVSITKKVRQEQLHLQMFWVGQPEITMGNGTKKEETKRKRT
jgi:hypothetical protein